MARTQYQAKISNSIGVTSLCRLTYKSIMYSRLRVCCSQSIGSATVAAFVGARRLSEQSGTGMVRTTTTTGLNLGFQKNRVVYAAAVAAAAAAVAASAAAAAAEGKDDPAFHFGLIADVQVWGV